MSRGLPDNWWTTDLDDEPCDGCGVKPSKHAGHGSYTCESCYEKRWCPKCHYGLQKDHVCVTPEQHAINEKQMREFFAEIDIEYPEDE